MLAVCHWFAQSTPEPRDGQDLIVELPGGLEGVPSHLGPMWTSEPMIQQRIRPFVPLMPFVGAQQLTDHWGTRRQQSQEWLLSPWAS